MLRYHLIISTVLYQYLKPFAKELTLNVGQLIALFVELSVNQIDLLYQEYGKIQHSIYELVDVNGKIDVNVYLQQNTYNQVKWLHGYHNNYSMAQVVRRCIFLMLILIKQFGSLEGAIAAIERLNQATEVQQNSKDEHGVIHQSLGFIHLVGGIHPSYEIVALYLYYMLFFDHPLPKIER